MEAWEQWAEESLCNDREREERVWIVSVLRNWSSKNDGSKQLDEVWEWEGERCISAQTLAANYGMERNLEAEGLKTLSDLVNASADDLRERLWLYEERRLLVNAASAELWGRRIRFVPRNAPVTKLARLFQSSSEAGAHAVQFVLEQGIDNISDAAEKITANTLANLIPEESAVEQLLEALEHSSFEDDIYEMDRISSCRRRYSLQPNLFMGSKLNGTLCLWGLQHVKSLPANLEFAGSLFVRNCASLETVGSSIRIGGDLNISFCPNLRSIASPNSESLFSVDGSLAAYYCSLSEEKSGQSYCTVNGDINLANCLDLVSIESWHCGKSIFFVSLPRLRSIMVETPALSQSGLTVNGNLSLRRCPRIKKLPDPLVVNGDTALSFLAELREIPAHFSPMGAVSLVMLRGVRGFQSPSRFPSDLRIKFCPVLEYLPSDLQVTGALEIHTCQKVERLPNLTLSGSLSIINNNALQHTGNNLTCPSNVEISHCNIVELPSIHTGESIIIGTCPRLVSFSGPIKAGKSISIGNCPELKSLPDEIEAGDDLDLSTCPSLPGLPPCVFQWGPSEIGRPHTIYIHNTGFPESEIERLRSIRNEYLRFQIRATEPAFTWDSPEFPSLAEGVDFWLSSAGEKPGSLILDPYISGENVRGVILFLSKLKGSQEFANLELRRGLSQRVVEALRILCDDDFAREEVVARIVDSVDACSDKPIWALNQIMVLCNIVKARTSSAELRRIALRVMRLGYVHAHAERKLQELGLEDDVCVYLRYEIALKDPLDLPVSAIEMLFPRYVKIPQHEFDKVQEEALSITEEQFEDWLENWPEWQRFQRMEAAKEIQWSQLKRNSRRFSLSWTDVVGSPLDDPVRLGKQSIWSLKDLLRHWVATGNDLNNVPLSESELKTTLSRCHSRSSSKRATVLTVNSFF